MYSDLFKLIRTQDDRHSFLEALAHLQASLYQGEGAFETVLSKAISADLAHELEKILADANQREKILNQLAQKVRELEAVELTLAFEPTEATVTKIADWIYQNISKDIVIDINIDKNILGGIIINRKGNYQDYSLKKKLSLYLANNQPQLISLL